ncbi:hypothetical protein [Yoonia sp.]|uniref:hypothetical protein n=1 Tax=Yoonia sp. TaxID=2212373 RepID=UPI00391DF660
MKRVEGMHLGDLVIEEDALVLRNTMINGNLHMRGGARVIVDGMVGGTLIADDSDVVLNGMAQRVETRGKGKIDGPGMRGQVMK